MKGARKPFWIAFVITIVLAYFYFSIDFLRYEKRPAPPRLEIDESEYRQALFLYQQAVDEKDPQLLIDALEILENAEISHQSLMEKFNDLRSQIYYAIDALNGIIYLDTENTIVRRLEHSKGNSLISPIDFTFFHNKIFIIDSGNLYEGNLLDIPFNEETLSFKTILAPGYVVDGYPVQSIVALDSINTNHLLYVLDQSGNVYAYDIKNRKWLFIKLEASRLRQPEPLYLNITTYEDRLYIIDQARNQIWRHPPNKRGSGVLKSKLPWRLKPGEPDVSSSIDLTVDGKIYALYRDGTITVFTRGKEDSFKIDGLYPPIHVEGFMDLPSRPAAIFTNVDSSILYIADAGRRSIVAVDKRNYKMLNQFVAPDNLDFDTLRAIVEKEGHIYILAGNKLYGYDYQGNSAEKQELIGWIPELNPRREYSMSPSDLAPNDPLLPSILTRYGFKLPLKEALLPDRSAVYPGSRRVYRYGVHQGLDLATKDIGVEVNIDSPVYAAGDGVVIRADTDYMEMTLKEVNALIEDSKEHHITSSEALEKLGGRQVWIEHDPGVATVYKHLSGIADGIEPDQPVESGQLIGYVGLSGTPDVIKGRTYFPHLHFEIRIGPEFQHYLGQWLTIEETRRAFEHIFSDVKVRPAYLDFRKKYMSDKQ